MRGYRLPLTAAVWLAAIAATPALCDTTFTAKGIKVVNKWVVDQTDLELAEAPANILWDDKAKTRFGYVDSQEDLAKLWKAWRKDEPPKVDFATQVVLVLTSYENARVDFGAALDDKGNLGLELFRTLRKANGMTYVIAVVERAGIKSIHGKPFKSGR